jgi:hypothetical protein
MRFTQRRWRIALAIATGLLAAGIAAAPAAANENMECSPAAIEENHEGCSADGRP